MAPTNKDSRLTASDIDRNMFSISDLLINNKNMNFKLALEALINGYDVKLPEWKGFWRWKDNEVYMYLEEGGEKRLFDSDQALYTLTNMAREDWQLVKGNEVERTVNTFNFSDALRHLKAGRLAARAGWNGKGMFIFIRPGDELSVDMIINIVKSLPQSVKDYFDSNGWYDDTTNELLDNNDAMVKFSPYICMKAADSTIVNGWLPSQSDILANDWILITS